MCRVVLWTRVHACETTHVLYNLWQIEGRFLAQLQLFALQPVTVQLLITTKYAHQDGTQSQICFIARSNLSFWLRWFTFESLIFVICSNFVFWVNELIFCDFVIIWGGMAWLGFSLCLYCVTLRLSQRAIHLNKTKEENQADYLRSLDNSCYNFGGISYRTVYKAI